MRIGVTTDFSARSHEAFEVASVVAKKFAAELHVIHHAQPGILSAAQDVGEFYRSLDQKLGELVASHAAFAGLDVKATLVRGGNVVGLAETLEKSGFDLLVMATHGRTGVKRFLLGSFTERLIRFAPCPVLVCRASTVEEGSTAGDATPAPASGGFQLRRLLVAVDFSTQGRVAVDYAREWAAAFGASVRLLHVVDSECGITGFEIELFDDWHQYHTEKKRQASESFAELAAQQFKGVEVDSLVKIGHPVLEILAESESFGADVIVMGTHGGPVLERYLLGSVAEKVVRKSKCLVLLAREPLTGGADPGAGDVESS